MNLRCRSDDGFGLIELLIAMVVLSAGILAVVAGFSSGIVSIGRSSQISVAAALADQQMELYRRLPYGCIYLTAAGTSSDWTGDAVFDQGATITSSQTTCSITLSSQATSPVQQITGPDHHRYELDTYIVSWTPTNGRADLKVSVAVHDGSTGRVWERQQSTFDRATGS